MVGILAAAGLLVYAALLCQKASLSAGGSDSSGYLNAARLLARGKLADAVEPLTRFHLSQDFVQVFIPLGFTPGVEPGTMVPSYPLGLPLHMAAAGLAGGWTRAPFWVSPLAAALALLLVYAIGRELGMGRAFAVAAAVCLAVFPTFVWSALQPMSDVPATAWALAAVLAALRARRRTGAAWLCGAAFGMAVLVRPTNILLLVPLLLALPLDARIILRFLIGGLPFAAFLFATNQIAQGSPFAGGNGDLSRFSLAFFPARFLYYGYWLSLLGTPLLVFGWLGVGAVRRLGGRDRLLLFTWPAVFLLFYCFWEPYESWWYTRFLLPAVPAMVLGLFFVIEWGFLPDRRPGQATIRPQSFRKTLAFAVSAIVLVAGMYWIQRFDVMAMNDNQKVFPDASRWAAGAVPPNAVVAAVEMTGAMKFYTNTTFARLDRIEPERLPALRAQVRAAGYRWYALVAANERELLNTRLPGSWREIGRQGIVSLLRLE